ncbi:HVA22-like protein k [Hibiscus syriacus]|uniref:HVA22-like protein n=1 Tax=Hibiscus syriacus TaxID=106335 RepID=A0A6A2YMR8_HIBSY|nr:HVA22-like protein k isoform X1 [Hibiscus syriacus]KAE8680641.1 HVA22-like protein k [Hibiscus syriacus]
MAFHGSDLTSEVGLRLLLWPLGSNIVTRAACCSVGVVLPVYSTFRAIERNNEREQQKWLIYWAAYGSFTLVETFSDKLLSWFPYYYHFKFAFLVWLQLPSTEGAKQIYKNHLRPNLLKHQAKVDQLMGFASAGMARFISAHHKEFQIFRVIMTRIIGSADAEASGGTELSEPRGLPAIDGPTDSESDNGD